MLDQSAVIAALHRNFASSEAGATVCVLSGGAGAGKTHVAERFIDELPRGIARFKGRGLQTGVAPLLPICEAIRTCSGDADLDPLRIAAERYAPAVPLVREAVGAQLLRRPKPRRAAGPVGQVVPSEAYTFVALAALVESMGSLKTPVLFLDDIQWMDSTSISFVGYLAARLQKKRLFLLLVPKQVIRTTH